MDEQLNYADCRRTNLKYVPFSFADKAESFKWPSPDAARLQLPKTEHFTDTVGWDR